MEKTEVIKKKVVYHIEDEAEIKLIRFCLDYCYHRAAKHHNTPLEGQGGKIDELRKQFDIY